MTEQSETQLAHRNRLVKICFRLVSSAALSFLLVLISGAANAQNPSERSAQEPAKKPASKKASDGKQKTARTRPVDELARLREEFVKATNDYKANLEKLRASYEKNVIKANDRLTQSKELFAAGLISRKDLDAGEREVADAKEKVTEVDHRMATADTQIAETLIEADTEKKLRRIRIPKGGIIRTTALIRYNGAAAWALSDAWKVQKFFLDTFKKPLPIAVFGQGAIHDRWHLDHRNSMDVSLHPDGPEGQALLGFLRNSGIPFLAFREAIPGTATGPHIHIGLPSHRY
jgi:hypothetical protein